MRNTNALSPNADVRNVRYRQAIGIRKRYRYVYQVCKNFPRLQYRDIRVLIEQEVRRPDARTNRLPSFLTRGMPICQRWYVQISSVISSSRNWTESFQVPITCDVTHKETNNTKNSNTFNHVVHLCEASPITKRRPSQSALNMITTLRRHPCRNNKRSRLSIQPCHGSSREIYAQMKPTVPVFLHRKCLYMLSFDSLCPSQMSSLCKRTRRDRWLP